MTRECPLPHDGVYTRLQPSSIHGVGVFAICNIPKGTYIFEPDDDDTVFVPALKIRSLSPEVRRLYEDFCVLEDGIYEYPPSLNKLTPAWFLNHSKSPNVSADSSLKFFADRDIEAGEELTADYGTYSENESDDKLD
jgi:SET domain-containing protein